ncbi:hypothetical protein COBT_001601 [Conglomerata obtusa]
MPIDMITNFFRDIFRPYRKRKRKTMNINPPFNQSVCTIVSVAEMDVDDYNDKQHAAVDATLKLKKSNESYKGNSKKEYGRDKSMDDNRCDDVYDEHGRKYEEGSISDDNSFFGSDKDFFEDGDYSNSKNKDCGSTENHNLNSDFSSLIDDYDCLEEEASSEETSIEQFANSINLDYDIEKCIKDYKKKNVSGKNSCKAVKSAPFVNKIPDYAKKSLKNQARSKECTPCLSKDNKKTNEKKCIEKLQRNERNVPVKKSEQKHKENEQSFNNIRTIYNKKILLNTKSPAKLNKKGQEAKQKIKLNKSGTKDVLQYKNTNQNNSVLFCDSLENHKDNMKQTKHNRNDKSIENNELSDSSVSSTGFSEILDNYANKEDYTQEYFEMNRNIYLRMTEYLNKNNKAL